MINNINKIDLVKEVTRTNSIYFNKYISIIITSIFLVLSIYMYINYTIYHIIYLLGLILLANGFSVFYLWIQDAKQKLNNNEEINFFPFIYSTLFLALPITIFLSLPSIIVLDTYSRITIFTVIIKNILMYIIYLIILFQYASYKINLENKSAEIKDRTVIIK